MRGFVHGELLIEMGDNVYCKSNDRLFSVIAFFACQSLSIIPFYQTPNALPRHSQFLSIQRGESS